MKRAFLLLVFSALVLASFSQDAVLTGTASFKKVFKRGYVRAGIMLPGTEPNPTVSAIQNFKDGNYGMGMGYQVDFGHIFYFLNRHQKRLINVGLDWTIINLEYAQVDQWDSYRRSNKNEIEIESPSVLAGLSSKLGPVVAINPVSKLVIEARVQAVYSARALYFSLNEYEETSGSVQYMNVAYENASDIHPGLGVGFGCTVRYGFVGLAIDYTPAKLKFPFEAEEPGGPETEGDVNVPYNNLSLKLNFTF